MTESSEDDIARRCSLCSYDWPDERDYKVCPSCGEKTDRCRDVTPMDEEEAASLKSHFDFERFYEDYDERMPAERLKPSKAEEKYTATLRTT